MRVDGVWIRDDHGRALILRGCNLGGSSKVPAVPDGATWRSDSLGDGASVSFVGRPFPEEEAQEHFEGLASRGFTFLRYVITWEALEHAGPGIYDESFLAYTRKILKKAEEAGISVFMDPHQDVWSRWTGGDGAPAWTLEKLGMRLDRMDAVGAALTHQGHGDPLPRMSWPTNYNRYAAATLFTLFFAGNAYAPETRIEGESAQDWLQERYLAAMRHCYRRLKDCKAIVGWGTMNEPHCGYIGYRDLKGLENNIVATGPLPSGFQSMAAASGHPVRVPVYHTGLSGVRTTGTKLLNPDGLSLFSEGFQCPWKAAGVWTDGDGEPRLLRPDHFSRHGDRPVRFVDDFLKPFMRRFTERMREANGKALIFVEGIPDGDHPTWSAEDGEGVVNAFHWYDGATLFSKTFRPWLSVRADTRKPVFGRRKVAESFRDQLAEDAAWSRDRMGGIPSLLGEFGLPFDMNGRRAFRTGDYRLHEEALSLYYDAVDSLLLHSTIWNYSSDNTNDRGDNWNDEDLSIYSGGKFRGEGGWRRPYPMATAGTPVAFRWDRKRRIFTFRYLADSAVAEPTVLYAPEACFGGVPEVRCEPELRIERRAESGRILIYGDGEAGEVRITVSLSGGRSE